MRDELQGILQKGESVLFNADKPKSFRKTSIFGVELALFLFLGSFFVIAIIGTFVFGLAHSDSITSISAKSLQPALWLIAIAILLVGAHRAIAKNLKLTSVIITEHRLFMAPPEKYVRKVGWEGPKTVADIVFADQLSAAKGTFAGSPCLIFTSLNPFFNSFPDKAIPTQKRYISVPNVDEAFEYLPAFLKTTDIQFEDIAAETPTQRYKRAADFLERRKARLGQK